MATVSENLQAILDIKEDIKEAIVAKGVSMTSYNDYGEETSVSFSEYANRIKVIPTFDYINTPVNTKFMYSSDTNTNVIYGVDSPESLFYHSTFTISPVIYIQGINVSADNMYYHCNNLVTIPTFNCESIISTYSMFDYCNNLTNVGGFNDMGKGFISGIFRTVSLSYCSKLTKESCLNIINSLYDLNLNKEYTNNAIIIFHQTPYSLLSPEDIEIATNKGWIVESA